MDNSAKEIENISSHEGSTGSKVEEGNNSTYHYGSSGEYSQREERDDGDITLEELLNDKSFEEPDDYDGREDKGSIVERLKGAMSSSYRGYIIAIVLLFVFFIVVSSLRDAGVLTGWQDLLIQIPVLVVILIFWMKSRK